MKKTSASPLNILAAIGVAFVVLAGTCYAMMIEGTIDLVAKSSFVVVDTQNNTVDFTPDSANSSVSYATGGFVSYIGEVATYNDFKYDPFPASVDIWSLDSGDVKFTLTSITSINESSFGTILAGTGVIYAKGYDPTPGDWTFTAIFAGMNSGKTYFTFANQTAANGVPDGGNTVILLGSALTGLGCLARFRSKFPF